MRLARRPLPRGTYSDWFWPPSPTIGRTITLGYSRFEHQLMVEVDPGPAAGYFWAHQFRFAGGQGGYVGLQSRGDRADGSIGKLAIFSIWDAVGATGSGAVRFGGEGSGWSCRIPYDWQAGQVYRLAVGADDDAPGWWEASVTDEATSVTQVIGRIQVPPDWRRLESWSVMWTEYFAPTLTSCAGLAHSRVVFGTPVADGSVLPHHHDDRIGDGTCEGSRVESVSGGVRHEMGAR